MGEKAADVQRKALRKPEELLLKTKNLKKGHLLGCNI